MKDISIIIVKNFYWVLIIHGITMMFGIVDWFSIVILVYFYLAIVLFPTLKMNRVDWLVISFLIYNIFSRLLSDYPFQLYYYGIKAQVMPVFFYFIGRSFCFRDDSFFEKFKSPLAIAFLVGIFLFLYPPSWYLDFKTRSIDVSIISSTNAIFERTRLSSFWSASYFIGYSSLFYVIYLLKRIVIDNDAYEKVTIFSLFIAFFCMFFSQQRVSIAYFLFFLIWISILSIKKKNANKRFVLNIWISIVVIGIIISIIVFTLFPPEYLEYLLVRSIDNDSSGGGLIKERVDLFSDFFKTMSFFGNGLGRYGHAAINYNMPCISDCDYVRIPNEIGYIGLALLLLIVSTSLFKVRKQLYRFFFEVNICIFFLLAMIGATPLEMNILQPFMLWFSLGHINNKLCLHQKLYDK